jgi:hypothetical protein
MLGITTGTATSVLSEMEQSGIVPGQPWPGDSELLAR